jgi:hypothetical protein
MCEGFLGELKRAALGDVYSSFSSLLSKLKIHYIHYQIDVTSIDPA